MTRLVLIGLLAAAWAGPSAADDVQIPRPEHPRPMAVRPHWANLNGTWQFRFDPENQGVEAGWFQPGAEGFDREIVVPFPWESELSGIGAAEDSPDIGWYRRTFTIPEDFPETQRVWLRFEAVDYRADVWINGEKVIEHEGGYTPFEVDITDALEGDRAGEHTLVVRAEDTTDPSQPVGKQVGWYTTTSGIWQTVWLEARPETYIKDFTIRTEIDPAQATFQVELAGPSEQSYELSVRSDDATVEMISARDQGRLDVPVREPKLWTPETPNLYEVTLELKDADGNVVDEIQTYFGLRTIARGKLDGEDFERIFLNGKPIYLRGALDQSFNPEGIYTAPSDAFLIRDLHLAKFAGLNFLRIHIKTEEPRRLYWADRLGMLIMQDIPNTWRQNERARTSWEHTMREAVRRDRNHPSIFAWVAFNETWGLGSPQEYKDSADTQTWVQDMVAAIRELDPTRLVEDNSPCNYDHVTGTDINSWHFYIDDHEEAERHIREVVEKTRPGSEFNYVPGMTQGTAPLINSEYGAVSAGGGDRDVSWGFRDLTTRLRKHNAIQGYIYTELTDIEWEHNGFFNYDRSNKVFGHNEWLPDMWINELTQADFVGYDGPPAIVGKPGETVEVPVFVSHYSDRDHPVFLRWWVQGWDERANSIMVSQPRSEPIEWERYRVTWPKTVRFTLPDRPFVGALLLTLRDENNARFAANFVNVVVQPEAPRPRVQRTGDHEATLRFRPEDHARAVWTSQTPAPTGKAHGEGRGFFEYRIQVPKAIVDAGPTAIGFRVEAGAKAGRERVDWARRVNRQDYPQTEGLAFPEYLIQLGGPRELMDFVHLEGDNRPTTLEVSVNGVVLTRDELTGDRADARGVLSHLAGVEHGSFGELVEALGLDLPRAVRDDLAAGKPLILRFAVPENADPAAGLAIFGADMGMYPIDPTIEILTERALPADLGIDPARPVTIDTAASRTVPVLIAGDQSRGDTQPWAYTFANPGDGWTDPGFDDTAWTRGSAGFGTRGTPGIRVRTRWDTPEIWLRTTVDLPDDFSADDILTLHLFHDEDVAIHVNGQPLHDVRGYVTAYGDIPLDDAQKALFRPGANTLAVHCEQTGGGQGVDVGLLLLKAE